MVAAGVGVRDAQQILGHTDSRLTLSIYAQATETGMRIATESTASRYLPSNHETKRTPADVPARVRTRDERGMKAKSRQSTGCGLAALPGESAGGGEGNRTPGLNSAIVALYQLSYTPAGEGSG